MKQRLPPLSELKQDFPVDVWGLSEGPGWWTYPGEFARWIKRLVLRPFRRRTARPAPEQHPPANS
jgi:hypothetical protein